jgi:hypothetical protein
MPAAIRITFGGKNSFCSCGNEWLMREERPGAYSDSPGSVHYHCTRCDLLWFSTGEGFQGYPRPANYRWAKGFVWRPGMKTSCRELV